MEFKDFIRELQKIVMITKFEDKLDTIDAEYPAMSSVAADLLEHVITGLHTDDGLITWWLYALNCGNDNGKISLPDDTCVVIKSEEDLFNVLTNKDLYAKIQCNTWEQMEIEM